MNKRTLIFVIITWFLLIIIQYYFLPYFIVFFVWLALSIVLFIIFIVQIIELIEERKSLSKFRIFKVAIFSMLFYFTYHDTLNGLIEKADWEIFYNRRMDIVQQVKQKKLNPNVSWNTWICELPYEFPVISNGGNDIIIDRNKTNETVTVTFFIFRNYFEAPSTEFVYTNDSEKIKELNKQIAVQPKGNWKIKDNWYKVTDR